MTSTALPVLLLAACLALTLTPGLAKPQCPGGPGLIWLADPNDCSLFYVCHGVQRFDFNCGQNVWNEEIKTCVGKGSLWDTCTIAKELDELNGVGQGGATSIDQLCANSPSAVYAKADNCAQYYDCSKKEVTVSGNDARVVECKFPSLYNEDTKSCENYDKVKCGDRKEPLDACEYVANQCIRSHCIPCKVRFPSCRGLPDGLNHWVGRDYSPYYVLCEKQRAIYHGLCDQSKGGQIFDPVKRVCTAAADSGNGSA